MARPEQHQEPFWNPPAASHSFWQVKEEDEETYPYQYPTYPSQYTPYNAEFISPSVTPAPYTVGSRTGSTCSTPPPVPVVPYLGNDWDDGDRSIPQGHYSSPRDAGHEEIIDARPLPATPVPITLPDPDTATPVRFGQVGTSTQKNRATIVDVEKVAAAPTTGGAFVTVFGKRYNKRPVIIIAAVIILLVIIAIGLGAGLGNKREDNKDQEGNGEEASKTTSSLNSLKPTPTPTSNKEIGRDGNAEKVGEARPVIATLPAPLDRDSDDDGELSPPSILKNK